MAKNTLPVNFQDDILNSAMGSKRRYSVINNSDGTISLEDATTYDQVGSNFGAGQMNATNAAVNASADAGKIIDDIDAIRNVTKDGYMAGALALKQIDNSLTNINVYVGDDKKLHFVDSEGADSVLPFSGEPLEIYITNSAYTSLALIMKGNIRTISAHNANVVGEYFQLTIQSNGYYNFTALKPCTVWYMSSYHAGGNYIVVESQKVAEGEIIQQSYDGFMLLKVLE